ncbi:hypothetical protein [Paenibacillus silvisoli]|uniref:hypothetical protein n=1 Tax=Paenibacillus silvisoli TaxID=3110539 RepID=UPI002804DDEB|nr:hypothetical protein [Paenibacillus silvisoli]
MKSLYGLAALFIILLTFLLVRVYSYSAVQVSSQTSLSITPESQALIAISYGEAKTFTVTNHLDRLVTISGVYLIGEADSPIAASDGTESPYFLQPEASLTFTLTGASQELLGKELQLFASWEGGSTALRSALPAFKEDEPELAPEKQESEPAQSATPYEEATQHDEAP